MLLNTMNYPFTPQPLLIVQEQFKNFRNIHVTIIANNKSISTQKGNYKCTNHIATNEFVRNSFVYLHV
jgi:hypothetical protein